ncbi:glycoside hydrolase family 2 TIM barrel-domain containing protein [Catenovulum agarivorans]|uniref:glycoside hydrolase family 2 TIM barrel-domain containing protein n=1 Tax=Catenovulum agarivorans TaxID=1172192 RepID=UPI001F18F885|nr:glycoside hydrolase family 2 TIM barrel-domain containing protein [Catenovulum agarivorans]
MNLLKLVSYTLSSAGILLALQLQAKQVDDFNFDWKFTLEKQRQGFEYEWDTQGWQNVRLPHDWAVALPYTTEGAASSGFKLGGIGWYRKSFKLANEDQSKRLWLEFDGIYNNAQIWVNGHYITERPYGYSSFKADFTDYAHFGDKANVVAVKVDRTAYADSRWYTGSGIYRNVRLVKGHDVHIPQWGVQVTTPEVSNQQALVVASTELVTSKYAGKKVRIETAVLNSANQVVASKKQILTLQAEQIITNRFVVKQPQLWSVVTPSSAEQPLYQLSHKIYLNNELVEQEQATFGIRSIQFDSRKGFFVNGVNTKIKGVNLHHDAGAVGTAVPKSVWQSRLNKLKDLGVNALRLSHNPHDPVLLDLADKMGFVVNAEAFDDWDIAKKKSKEYLGDNKASGEAAISYDVHFNQWAERDIKDLVRRDFNHPSVIMWSIGNEIEWTHPHYPAAVSHTVNGTSYYEDAPDFAKEPIMQRLKKANPEAVDSLPIIANRLAKYVKEIDTTRPVTAGLTHPSVGFASGYTDALDIVGFNYRAAAYAKAHETYPDKVIYGSENWGAWREWRDVKDKDYVAGIFIWTGFAYKGEAGPMPRMGLDISLFDFVGNITPRGHFFKTLWQDKPHMYLGTTAASESEFSFDKNSGWTFTPRKYPAHIWDKIRMWEWYDVNAIWQYNKNEPVVVQVYTNTESAELFLNGKSVGKHNLLDFDDRVIKWLVPYQAGELKVVGYNQGKKVSEQVLNSLGQLAQIELTSERAELTADQYDTSYVHAVLKDQAGNILANSTDKVEFIVEGPATRLVVDNGSEYNVQDVLADSLGAHRGRAAMLIQAGSYPGKVKVTAKVNGVKSNPVFISLVRPNANSY